jgi:hypothetical protein
MLSKAPQASHRPCWSLRGVKISTNQKAEGSSPSEPTSERAQVNGQ